MASRSILNILNVKKPPTAEDLNILYRMFNGQFSPNKGNGMSIKFTAFDGRMPTGLLNVTDYALEIRNREATAQKTVAFRRADNKIVSSVEGGLLLAVKDTSVGTSPTQVVVYGTPAGGVLGGTYPNPSFAIATEYHRVYPAMIVPYYGVFSTTSRSDGFASTNLECTNVPGWVFCVAGTGTVRMRDGSFVTVPNATDRYPLGAGGTFALGATFGNNLATLQATSIAHSHNHNHTISHTHNATGLFGPSHTHGAGLYVIPNHSHASGTIVATDHSHDLNSHTHGPNSLSFPHQHNHSHNHSHGLDLHNHGAGTLHIGPYSTATANNNNNVTRGGTGSNTPDSPHQHNFTIDHDVDSGHTSDGHLSATAADFTSTQPDNTSDSSNISSTGTATGTTSGPTPTTSGGTTTHTTSGSTAIDGTASITGTAAADGTQAVTGVTADTNSANSGDSGFINSSVSSINVLPNGIAWYWIMKL